MKRVCFFHAGCPDGFGAAWAVRRAWGDDAAYIARGHDDIAVLELCRDATVAFVDIAPGNEELEQIADVAAQVIVLDHHITSLERFESAPDLANRLHAEGHEIHFELGHSGAVLAWHYFNGEDSTPDLLRYVEDQDLWNWKLAESDRVNAALGSYPHDFDVWDGLAEDGVERLAREGEPILRANRAEIVRMLHGAAPIAIGSHRLEAVNSTTNRSRIGHALAERAAFGTAWGCVYRVVGDRVQATLYSIGEIDVAELATSLGGGGHKNAAGFSVTLADWVRDFVV